MTITKDMHQAWQAWHHDLDPEDTPAINSSFKRGWQAGQAAIKATVLEPTPCNWAQDDSESDAWGTGCGKVFRLDEGLPSDNKLKFCCYCGKPLTESVFELEDGE